MLSRVVALIFCLHCANLCIGELDHDAVAATAEYTRHLAAEMEPFPEFSGELSQLAALFDKSHLSVSDVAYLWSQCSIEKTENHTVYQAASVLCAKGLLPVWSEVPPYYAVVVAEAYLKHHPELVPLNEVDAAISRHLSTDQGLDILSVKSAAKLLLHEHVAPGVLSTHEAVVSVLQVFGVLGEFPFDARIVKLNKDRPNPRRQLAELLLTHGQDGVRLLVETVVHELPKSAFHALLPSLIGRNHFIETADTTVLLDEVLELVFSKGSEEAKALALDGLHKAREEYPAAKQAFLDANPGLDQPALEWIDRMEEQFHVIAKQYLE